TRLGMDLKASGVLNDESMPLQAQVREFSADTLGGSVHLAQLNYPFSKDKTSDLMLDKLDLSQLIALGDKQIKVTGLLNGTLPLLLSDQGVTIRQGQVIGKEGEIILQDNPAWQAMLQQQPVLASQLKHLNHLHYDLLQGDIAMEADGQLTAELTIKGENRAESQPVNLNFTSEQNILTLLKALRLSDQIDKSLSESAQGMYQ
ncbi:MAG: YdbH domain-containing protein, partial [Oceanospirillum sp.]|nr:YdbH domain-containing protein [Oceanospirillum sp.]